MPQVKGYGQQQVESTPLQGGLSQATYTKESPIGDALSGIGAKLYDNEIKRQDQVAFLEADRKLSSWEQNALYDPKAGALTKRGKDAFGVPDEVGKNYDSYVEEVRGSLSNERQRQAFDRSVSSRRKDMQGTLARHVFSESRKFEESETENYIANATQSAILNAGDAGRVELELARAEAAVRDYSKRNGLGPEYEKQKVAQVRSNTHVGIIDRLIANGQDRAAREYFNGTGDAGENLYKSAPGMIEAGNINLKKRDRVDNGDGSVSTVRSMSIGEGDREVVIPTVVDGKVLSDEEAIAHYHKTGEHLGKFKDEKSADAFAQSLHLAQSAYYMGAKHEIAGDDVAKVEAKLKSATTAADGLRGAGEIWQKLGPKSDISPVETDKLIAEAEKQYGSDPHTLKAVKEVLKERADLHNASQRERHEGNSSAVWKAIEQNAGLAQVQRMPAYLALPGHEQNTIKNWIIDRADLLKRRADTDGGDDALYYRLSTEASTPALQDKFMTTNLLEHRAKLSRAQFNHLIEVQGSLRKGDDKNAAKLMTSETQQRRIVDDAVLGLGLDPTPNEKYATTDKGKQVLDFRRVVRDTVRQHELRTGKNATDQEVQDIVDGLVIKGTKPGSGIAGFFQSERRVYELKPGETLAIKAADIPREERRKIEDALRRAGRAATDDAVTTLYTSKLLKMRGTPQAADPSDPRRYVPN